MRLNQCGDEGRVLQVGGVTCARNRYLRGVRPDRTHQSPPELGKFLVVLTGDDEYRHGQSVESVPQGELRTGSRQPQARCQTGTGIPTPLLESVSGRLDTAEHWISEPSLKEGVQSGLAARPNVGRTVLSWRRVEFSCHFLIFGSPVSSVIGRIESPGARDEHQRSNQVGPVQCQMKTEPGSHRVTDIGAFLSCFAKQVRAFNEVSGHVGGSRMAGHVHPHHLMIDGQALVQCVPHPTGLRKPVGEYHPGSHSYQFAVQLGSGPTGRRNSVSGSGCISVFGRLGASGCRGHDRWYHR